MPRSNIRDKTKDALTDDGAVIYSIAKGEQIALTITIEWLSDLSDWTITAKVVEALNVAGDGDTPPLEEDTSVVVTDLPILDADPNDNVFKVVLTKDMSDNWSVQPSPDDPTYGFIAIQMADSGVGDAQQVLVPIRGLVEVRYNPVETVA